MRIEWRGISCVVCLLCLVALAGCGAQVISGQGGGDGGGGDPDLPSAPWDLTARGGCQSAADCDGGTCVAGACCAGVPCGGACCGASTVCLFDRCVTPGKHCRTANDCDPGQYCEPSLGGGGSDGGSPALDGGCAEALPPAGRCLDLPPVCAGDGGMAPDAGADTDGGCVDRCEYHPKAGPLDAVPKWTWGPTAKTFPQFTDVWSTPAVGRVVDANCDGKVDELDPPNIVFVAGNVAPTNTPRDNGVLRVLDGRSGAEVWSLRSASMNSKGFMGFSIAIGDIDGDGRIDILAVTGEGFVVMVDGAGKVVRTSDKPIAGASTGWGGGLAIADMDGDGDPEIAFGETVFSTTGNAITRKFVGAAGSGGGADQQLSTFADVDGDKDLHLELVAGKTVYRADGTILWNRNDLPDGFPAVGDLNKDGKPEVVLVDNGKIWILDAATGQTTLGPVTLGGTGTGGPPTIADFDGDGLPEIGVAQANFYSVVKPNYGKARIDIVWQVANHDLSSSVTGSSVFDFEGDGKAEVIYGDECYLWVFEGATGKVRFATPHTSFTATEASLVADVDGDGRAEILMVSNGADPGPNGWACDVAPWNQPDKVTGRPAWKKPAYGPAYRGLVLFGDRANGWVGTRTLWNEHAYHVTNVCDSRDTACNPPNVYGSIPRVEKSNWLLSWLNDFRQNVQDKGLFDAPDAVVSLTIECAEPPIAHPAVRNIGLASLPAGVLVDVFKVGANGPVRLGGAMTSRVLFPGQGEVLSVPVMPNAATTNDTFIARIVVDPMNATFRECRSDNDESAPVKPICVQ